MSRTVPSMTIRLPSAMKSSYFTRMAAGSLCRVSDVM